MDYPDWVNQLLMNGGDLSQYTDDQLRELSTMFDGHHGVCREYILGQKLIAFSDIRENPGSYTPEEIIKISIFVPKNPGKET